MATELLIILALVLANGLFAGAEIALLSVRKTRLQEAIGRRDRRALAVAALRDQPERFLATVQVGITVVSSAAAAFGGARMAGDLAPVLARLGLGDYAASVAFALVIALVSFLSLVLGELVPKSLALRYSDSYAFLAARPLLLLSRLAAPIIWVLTTCSNALLRLFGDRTTFTETRLSRSELQQMVEEAAKTGSVDASASEIASRALGFAEVSVAELMVPRTRVIALRRDAPLDELRRIVLEEGHGRMPVYDGHIDNVIGYVVARDVLALAWQGGLVVLEDIIRPPFVVAAATPAVEVLRTMQRKRIQMAAVTDEDGGLAGLITIEDLLEELVGEILSEDDVPHELVLREPGGTMLVPGWAPLRKLNRELSLDLPIGKSSTTVAGLCMMLALAIPQAGTKLRAGAAVLEVVEASARRVRKVRIHPHAVPDEPDRSGA
jgi:putative hemolysin